MTKYLYLFRGGDARRVAQSPEEREAHMQKWGVWMENLAKEGKLVDGLPLGMEGKVVQGDGTTITDGPFAEGVEYVGGYLIVNASSLDEAAEIALGCPIFEHGGTVEVRETMNMG